MRRLSPTAEFSVVVAGAFGLFIFASVRQAVSAPAVYSEGRLWHLLLYELPVMAVLLLFLKLRGWTLADIGLRPALGDPLLGIGLAIACYMAFYAAALSIWFTTALAFGWPLPMRHVLLQPGISLVTAAAVSLVNPIFEEIFVCGYIVSALERAQWRSWSAINVSVAVRLAYHLYQGPIGVISIVPTGLIFAFWYAQRRRLWPPIIAHGIIDFVALASA